MVDEKFLSFILVGGTALALQMGHRISTDLDFFSQKDFDENRLSEYLQDKYAFTEDFRDSCTLKGFINDVKVDIISHRYSYVKQPVVIDHIRMASVQDIAAMKINAIHGNGTRVKDFTDIAFLSSVMSLKEMLESYITKYPKTNEISAVKALSYFEDIHHYEKVQLIHGVFNLDVVKKRILEMTLSPAKIFPKLDFTLYNQRKMKR
jgi:predicted nucleotidyltransferase component of viral defense system